ncbi:MAG: N-acetylglucosamine repressor [Clostridiales bacterium]|jgi:glucokinase-like ROK family protein|nr:N-acetylglucosamine repressor [Clostridiales bacterium]
MVLNGQNMTEVKLKNRSVVLRLLFKYGPISRAQLSQVTGLTPPTITSLVGEMINEGIVIETGNTDDPAKGGVGRKRVLIDLKNDAKYEIGIEFGVETTHMGINDLKGNLVCDRILPIITPDPTERIRQTAREVVDMLSEREIPMERVLGIGVGVPGLVDRERGINRKSPNLGWKNVNVRNIFSEVLSMPVLLENNVRCMALGEQFFGFGREMDDIILFHVGMGIGCGIIIDGRLFHGSSEGAGEIGHTTIDINGPQCGCGKKGCLEALASGRAIADKGREFLGRDVSAYDVFLAAKAGDPIAAGILKEAGYYLGIGVANLINLFNPQMVVLHGGVLNSGDIVLKPLLETASSHVFSDRSEDADIKLSAYGDELGIMGASALVLKELFFKL